MTRGVLLDLDQAGVTLLGHSQCVQFDAGLGGILGKVFSKVFSKVFRMAHT
ncbi:hypothetical protein [Bradyrhizobium sp. cf659]|uniref:hypothetical protein n=1 Tax=Bradyrhizobium sp. cf659 TaxID=1761771 RepID=UPI0008EE8048|nr:hypothetical protein [Bradyrhizobium sp. cf659]SFJ97802.1 hypothetical protein SAMN04487925_11470 [Bradyrhizobium sp. cf659]